MTEGLADAHDLPGQELNTLYSRWSSGGAGLLLSGNIMVDARYLERSGNMVLEETTDLAPFKKLAAAGKTNNSAFWVQLNHPGRQCNRIVNARPIAPSAIQLELAGSFGQPREMSEEDIRDVIHRFAITAQRSKQAGFDGVQIHSAHGYLSSQFLSPLTNRRQDQWGGSLENRARFLLETVAAVRQAVGNEFPIGVKLNSADFQEGGFALSDCQQVAAWLNEAGIDLLEVSGGTYESLVWLDNSEQRESTRKREAFFLEYADSIRQATSTPLMVTGGFRSSETINNAIADGATDVVGIGRPFCVDPDFPKALLGNQLDVLPIAETKLKLGNGWLGPASRFKTIRGLNNQGHTAWFYQQILRLANNQPVLEHHSVLRTFIAHNINEMRLDKRRVFKQQ